MSSELWQRLRYARKGVHLTQSDVAEACGVTRGAVAIWEARDPTHRVRPRLENLQVVAALTKVTIDWLTSDVTEVTLPPSKKDPEVDPLLYRQVVPAAPRPGPQPELPDLRQGEHMFCFASTAQQIEAKLKVLKAEPETTKGHLVLIGAGEQTTLHCVQTPSAALGLVIEVLNGER